MAITTLPLSCDPSESVAQIAMTKAEALLDAARTNKLAPVPVENYRYEVETLDEGRAFLRAGVDGGQCKRMSIVAVDTGSVLRLFVADTEGARHVVRMCNLEGWAWAEVEERQR